MTITGCTALRGNRIFGASRASTYRFQLVPQATITVESVVVGHDDDGKPKYRQRRRTVTGATQEQVDERLDALRRSLDVGPDLPAEMTVGRFLNYWLTEVLALSDVAPGTIDNYTRVVRLYLVPTLGRIRLDQLAPADVRKMIVGLRDQGLSPNTQRLARSVLRRALRTAEAEEYVTRNVAAIVDGVRQSPRKGRTLNARADPFAAHRGPQGRARGAPDRAAVPRATSW